MKMKNMTNEKIAISTKTEGETGGILIPKETELMTIIGVFAGLFTKLSLFSQNIFKK